MYLYLSKLRVPVIWNPKLKDYEKYKFKFNKDFISGIALACYQLTSEKNIYKYALASDKEEDFYSIYEYAEENCDLNDYISIYPNKYFFEIKKNTLGGKYINFKGNDFLRGWMFIFDHFSMNFKDYVLNYYIPSL